MIRQRPIELLAPAKNLECGMEAINHGADAVYIGAPRFGARAAAGNSLEDIEALVRYAHLYRVRIYVTVNTILKEEELADTEKMIWDLYRVGVDALIVQDMGITRLNLPPIPLHASTQMDNRTPQKVKFLAEAGFRQVVLARELTLDEIAKIHAACPDTPLEVFVHGALCVSYSGQCYVSQACFGRSANRGECAQFCRLSFDMVDADGKTIARGKHLLSLKDMNQSDNLEALLDAGASSLKIEGRLKDVAYVKNVTAYYRQKLDAILKRRKEYVRASSGTVRLAFRPQLDKSFSRGFTDYFLHGRTPDIFSFHTPKSLGEEMGVVKEVRGNYFTVAGVKPFSNGDGLCYLDEQGKLHGFRVNRVENNKLYPQEMPRLRPKTKIYRNFDQEFERVMQKKSAERKIAVSMLFEENNFGFTLTLTDEDDNCVSVTLPAEKTLARTPQAENLKNQLGKLGNTPFELEKLDISLSADWFVPSSALADLRRNAVEKLLEARRINYPQERVRFPKTTHAFIVGDLTYLGNVMNTKAQAFYHDHGVKRIEPAFEKEPRTDAVLMFCKHCLRYSMGWCPVHHKVKSPYKEPYYLVSTDGRRFRLDFDCKVCQMKVSLDNQKSE
jgi:collagenase-like PrtC family protease